MEHKDRMEQYRLQVEAGIQKHLPPSGTRPSRLHAAMLYSMEGGGKRLRPVLLLAACDAFRPKADPLPAAVAVECLHGYSLVHDDLPCMDDSNLRRGKPSCHKQFDEVTAVLAGDALLTHAFALLGREYTNHPAISCALVHILGQAAGSEQLIGGQMEDIVNEGQEPDAATLEYIHRNKTAALLCASLEMGAAIGGATKAQRALIRQFGEKLGMTFQIVDDLLDHSGDQEAVGKPVGADADSGKTTILSICGPEEARAKVETLTNEASQICRQLAGENSFLEWIVRKMAKRVS
jgi:geranylgeranyl diphosphate synthase type II